MTINRLYTAMTGCYLNTLFLVYQPDHADAYYEDRASFALPLSIEEIHEHGLGFREVKQFKITCSDPCEGVKGVSILLK